MSSLSQPRVVLVRRKTAWEHLLERYGTEGQAVFYLQSRGNDPQSVQQAHAAELRSVDAVLKRLPTQMRRVVLERSGLDRFLFDPEDRVLAVGQDGLIANIAKYVRGQIVAGINPLPSRYDGILCPHTIDDTENLLTWMERPTPGLSLQARAMVQARREDGQSTLGLNEIFVGHRTHQSARYVLRVDGREERQSSSGLIVATGTGASGWALSIALQRNCSELLPEPTQPMAAWFSREPFPSRYTGHAMNAGRLNAGDTIEIHSEMEEGGAVFADGMEEDRLEFVYGQRLTLGLAPQPLNLLMPPNLRR